MRQGTIERVDRMRALFQQLRELVHEAESEATERRKIRMGAEGLDTGYPGLWVTMHGAHEPIEAAERAVLHELVWAGENDH